MNNCTCRDEGDKKIGAKIDFEMADEILKSFDSEKSNLITLLQELQAAYGYLSKELLQKVSEVTAIKEAKIYGVVTFYSQFRMKPIGKKLIMLCQGTACHVNGSSEIEKAVKDFLGVEEGEITEDGEFTYINVACLGCCSLAPVMMVNDQTFGKLTPDKVSKILSVLRHEEVIQ